jgi:hypothetical protein
VANKFVQNLATMSVGKALFEAQHSFTNTYTPYLLAGVPWLTLPRFASQAAAIMKANSLLKGFKDSDSGNTRVDHGRLAFQEQQRKILLKQLFDKSGTS